jgi:hypothetical protein
MRDREREREREREKERERERERGEEKHRWRLGGSGMIGSWQAGDARASSHR